MITALLRYVHKATTAETAAAQADARFIRCENDPVPAPCPSIVLTPEQIAVMNAAVATRRAEFVRRIQGWNEGADTDTRAQMDAAGYGHSGQF